MNRIAMTPADSMQNLASHLSRGVDLDAEQVLPFIDYTDTLTALFDHVTAGRDRILVGGHASPDLLLAADRNDLKVVELIGDSPFHLKADNIIGALTSSAEVVMLSNPNCVTGANLSTGDLARIAEAVTDGWLIIDEEYFDFYGISGMRLIDVYSHIVVFRSLTSSFGIRSDRSGFLIGSPGLIGNLKNHIDSSGVTRTRYAIMAATLTSEKAKRDHVESVRDESLRVASALTRLGVQNRITATDFLLLRVADPARVGNQLASHSIAVENLDGYRGLNNYLRYRLQSPLSNDRLLLAFQRMSRDYYHLEEMDRRVTRLHKPPTVGSDADVPKRQTTKKMAVRSQTKVVGGK